MAYRFNDSKITIENDLVEHPLVSRHKAILSLHYATRYDRWKFSLTNQYHGRSRLPNTASNPVQYQLPSRSPEFFIIHAQVSRKFKIWEVYLGVENLLNYKQDNPILSSENPFGNISILQLYMHLF